MQITVGVLLGLLLGCLGTGLVVFLARRFRPDSAPTDAIAAELRNLAEEQRRASDESLTRLFDANRDLLNQERLRAGSELDGKKGLIDQQLVSMTAELDKVGEIVKALEADRRNAFGQLTNELQRQHEGLTTLSEHTQQLREALSSSRVRGQWGERMAEDVLRLSGLIEGVNYRKQVTLTGAGRPDYTFLLPNGLVMHMDVKFPLDNYIRFLEATNEMQGKQYRDQFLRDVRDRVKELRTRGYLDGVDETVDCLLLFIPNEQVYAFVQEHDRAVLDDALARQDRDLFTDDAVRGARRRAPGGRQLPPRAGVERDPRSVGRLFAAVGEVRHSARGGATPLRAGQQGLFGADDDEAPCAATPARQDRGPAYDA